MSMWNPWRGCKKCSDGCLHCYWNIADTVTAMRIAASLFLPFFHVQSIWFLVIYTFAGLTDVLDGWIARKFGMESEFGARLDSIADLVFYGILLIYLLPVCIGFFREKSGTLYGGL